MAQIQEVKQERKPEPQTPEQAAASILAQIAGLEAQVKQLQPKIYVNHAGRTLLNLKIRDRVDGLRAEIERLKQELRDLRDGSRAHDKQRSKQRETPVRNRSQPPAQRPASKDRAAATPRGVGMTVAMVNGKVFVKHAPTPRTQRTMAPVHQHRAAAPTLSRSAMAMAANAGRGGGSGGR